MNQFRALALMSLAVFAVLDPFLAMAAQPQPAKPENVLKLLESNKDFSKFADLIDDADIESELTNKSSKVTVFAPTNAAMDKLPSDVLKRAKASKDGLKSLVRYHMINGSAVFATNIKGRRAGPSTANGEMVGFDGTGKELMVNQAVIVTPDQYALNGVVHAINAPLIPESLKDPKIKEEAREKEERAMKEQMEAQEEERNKEMKKREKENATTKLEQKAAEEKVKAEADSKAKEEAEAKAKKEVKAETAPAAVKAPVVDSKTEPTAASKTTEKVPAKTEVKPEAKPDAKATVKTPEKTTEKKPENGAKTGAKTETASPVSPTKAPKAAEPMKTAPAAAAAPKAAPTAPPAPAAPAPVQKEEKKGLFNSIFGN